MSKLVKGHAEKSGTDFLWRGFAAPQKIGS
jgi:hypothetical protein